MGCNQVPRQPWPRSGPKRNPFSDWRRRRSSAVYVVVSRSRITTLERQPTIEPSLLITMMIYHLTQSSVPTEESSKNGFAFGRGWTVLKNDIFVVSAPRFNEIVSSRHWNCAVDRCFIYYRLFFFYTSNEHQQPIYNNIPYTCSQMCNNLAWSPQHDQVGSPSEAIVGGEHYQRHSKRCYDTNELLTRAWALEYIVRNSSQRPARAGWFDRLTSRK